MFDPYYKWLGIPPRQQPPSYYRLLNLDAFESDLEVIEGAADRAMGFIRQYQSGEHAALAAKLLNEISTARLCLLKPDTKASYDAKLRKELAAANKVEAPTQPKRTAPLPEEVEPERLPPRPRPSKPRKTPSKSKNPSSLPLVLGGVAAAIALVSAGIWLRGTTTPPAPVPSAGDSLTASTSNSPIPENASPSPKNSDTAASTKDNSPSNASATISPVTPAAKPVPPASSPSTNEKWQPGFLSQFYAGTDFSRFIRSRVDDAINFQFGLDAPDTGVPDDQFSIRWLAAIQAPITGKYEFQVAHDDGVRVWIDDRKLLDQWQAESSSEKFEVELTAGWHQFRLDYFDQKDLAAISVRWKPPGKEFEPFRGDYIRHNPAWSGRNNWDRRETPDQSSPSSPEGLLKPADIKTAQYRESQKLGMPVEFTNSIGMPLRLIPPGQFMMGSPSTDSLALPNETPQVRVSLTQPFYLGQFEVTQREWTKVMKTTPWDERKTVVANPDHPAVMMDWHQAREFCDKLTKLDRAANKLKPGWSYDLPTEAQWEFASRAGTTNRFGASDDEQAVLETDWVRENSGDKQPQVHPVGQKKPNGFDCFDMLGNVTEICRDPYTFELLAGKDPLKFSTTELYTRRGRAAQHPAREARIARRAIIHERKKAPDCGFRVCLAVEPRTADPTMNPYKADHSLTIRGVLDGADDFRIYPDRVELIHHTWAPPEHLSVNDAPWTDPSKPFLISNGPIPVGAGNEPTLFSFYKSFSRDQVTYKRHPEYVEISTRDESMGGTWYELTISWETTK